MKTHKILIVEDDRALCAGIAVALRSENMEFAQCHSMRAAREHMRIQQYELILLDINLPDGNGLEFLKEIRKQGAAPVILLTANDMETDIVAGLSLGADDYITKPFSLAILRARVEVQLRKGKQAAVFWQDGYRFDFENQIFERDGSRIELSRTEQKILSLLVKNRGKTIPRERLFACVWEDGFGYVDENALSVAVNRLRTKLDCKKYLRTVYGIGYCWEETVI